MRRLIGGVVVVGAALAAALAVAGRPGVAAGTNEATGVGAAAARTAGAAAQAGPGGNAVYLVYYWRARPGKQAAYSDYIRRVAEPIDEEARKADVFEEVHTYTPAIATGAPGADWTHMRVFRLKNFASWDAFGAGMDAATLRVYPDEARRRDAMSGSGELRDLVRQEIWREFR